MAGYYYAPDAAHTRNAVAAARAGEPVGIGRPTALWPTIMAGDAASAVVAAVRAPSGVFDAVDDRPLSRAGLVEALGAALGGPALAAPAELELPAPWAMLLRSDRVSNRSFRATTGWTPRFPGVDEHHRRGGLRSTSARHRLRVQLGQNVGGSGRAGPRRPGPAWSELADGYLDRFVAALERGDLDDARELMADDVVAYRDGGGKASAAPRPVEGAHRVAGFFGALSFGDQHS